MQHDHVLNKRTTDPIHRTRGGSEGKIFAIMFMILFDFGMQHDRLQKKFNFDLLTPPPNSTKRVTHRPLIENHV